MRAWWAPQPTLLAWLLWPLSWLYQGLFRLAQSRAKPETLPVPVIVVGNLIVGGAGKTPTVIALVRALRASGWHPGVISRGYGSRNDAARAVSPDATAAEVGDEPALIARATAAPTWVGRQRAGTAQRLCAAHPQVDVIVSDDGLQHAALSRQLEVLVFDERGIGNGLLLPAGPLREPMWRVLTPKASVLYNAAAPSTALPGLLIERRLSHAVALHDWVRGEIGHGQPLSNFAARHCIAAAGIAAPERFLTMLEAAGLSITRLPLPDHHDFAQLPWAADTGDVFVTEKDAIKLQHLVPAHTTTSVWVVGLDFVLPPAFLHWVHAGLAPFKTRTPP